ncbi:hypothetical protein JW848_07330 [Candidatus Bipolaricaulota bacterium]|nr:hypothetical protein [Candidatus Bipolaricaulota bacterium]
MRSKPGRWMCRRSTVAWTWIGLAALVLALFGLGVLAQDPILEVSSFPDVLQLPPDGEAVARVFLGNPTITEADDAEVFLLVVPDDLAVASDPEILAKIDPFSDGYLDLRFLAQGLPEGTYEVLAELVYTYCDDDSCFEVVEPLSFVLDVREGAVPIAVDSFGSHQGAVGLLPLLIAGVVLAAALIVFVFVRKAVIVVLAVGLIAVGALAYGVLNDQHEQAQGIGSVLCTSCVGIEESSHGEPSLSAATRSALAAIEGPETTEVLVFYAVWCHSCPYAEAMVEAFAAESRWLEYRFIDVEMEPEQAAQYNVIRSGRTIVPATVLPETGTVLFGVADLEQRLLDALRRAP